MIKAGTGDPGMRGLKTRTPDCITKAWDSYEAEKTDGIMD